MTHAVLLHDPTHGQWLAFREPQRVLTARSLSEVAPVLEEVAARVHEDGLWAAGFLSYEAASAFDPAFRTHPPLPDTLPLLWFGLFSDPDALNDPFDSACFRAASFRLEEVHPSVDEQAYLEAIRRIHRLIEKGNTYQVNYTLRLTAPFEGDPRGLFREMAAAQEPPYAAYLEDVREEGKESRWAICSASPELFFRLDGGRVRQVMCRPMKGTAGRGRTLAEDEAQRQWLAASEKNRAENLMIVDMVRNDLGRIAEAGSVTVPKLFTVERYPSVWQMTSEVTARPRAEVGFAELLAALFPCASITGAPKARTTEIITELESTPRGIYTGAIGYLAPDGTAQMNVAIRTVEVDRRTGAARYGVGGGIVWDSVAEDEYRECRVKALALPRRDPRNGHSRRPPRDFKLLETLLWEPPSPESVGGIFLLERHLARLRDAATYFAYPLAEAAARRALDEAVAALSSGRRHRPQRLRLLVDRRGQVVVESYPLDPAPEDNLPIPLRPAAEPIDPTDPFLFHKTTHRQVYEEAYRSTVKPAAVGRSPEPRPTENEVLLWNPAGEVTEGTIANIVARRNGRLITPPVECGLLAGTFRQELLERGEIQEGVLRVEDLVDCEELWLINSVRRWRRACCSSPVPSRYPLEGDSS